MHIPTKPGFHPAPNLPYTDESRPALSKSSSPYEELKIRSDERGNSFRVGMLKALRMTTVPKRIFSYAVMPLPVCLVLNSHTELRPEASVHEYLKEGVYAPRLNDANVFMLFPVPFS